MAWLEHGQDVKYSDYSDQTADHQRGKQPRDGGSFSFHWLQRQRLGFLVYTARTTY